MTGRKELFQVPAGHSAWTIRYLAADGSGKACSMEQRSDAPERVEYELTGEKVYYVTVGRFGAFIAEANTKKPTGGNGEWALR